MRGPNEGGNTARVVGGSRGSGGVSYGNKSVTTGILRRSSSYGNGGVSGDSMGRDGRRTMSLRESLGGRGVSSRGLDIRAGPPPVPYGGGGPPPSLPGPPGAYNSGGSGSGINGEEMRLQRCMSILCDQHDKGIVDMVLRDVVQRDMGVSFDDIAALSTAKRLLNEAIVLPLMMPEFFTGIREPWKVLGTE